MKKKVKKTIFKSLRFKFIFLAVVVTVVGVSIVSTFVILDKRQYLYDGLYQKAKLFSRYTPQTIYDFYGSYYIYATEKDFQKFKELTKNVLAKNKDIKHVMLINTKNIILFDSSEFEHNRKYDGGKERTVTDEGLLNIIDKLKENVKQGKVEPLLGSTILFKDENVIELISPVMFEDIMAAFVVYHLSVESINYALAKTTLVILGVAAGLIGFGIMLAIFFANIIIRPVEKVSSMMREISTKEDFTKMLEIKRDDEIGELSSSFNKMTLDLKKSREKLTNYNVELEKMVKERTKELRRLAYYDSLTNLPNRALFQDRMNQAIAHARRYKRKAAVLFLDLDNFKRINDTLDHRMGDLLLKEVAVRLNRSIRKTDTVTNRKKLELDDIAARLGGDEFIILLSEINCANDTEIVAQRFLDTLLQPFRLDSHEVFVTASIGIAIYPNDGEDMDSILKNADIAMYHAKDKGKNNFQFYKHSMNSTALEKLTMENDLRKAEKNGELMLYYQPQMDIRTWEIIGMEALIRWDHPDRGVISPDEFIPLAEETGLIMPIGKWVLDTVCRQNRDWQSRGLPPVRVAVNLSGRQFQHEGLVKTVREILESSGLDPQYLELEFTESVMMKNVETTIEMLHELKKMGVRLSIDDFGTGYSSFSYLKRFPLDAVKVDSSFIKDITENDDDAAIVSAIIAMAHNLNLKVIAECVETEEQLMFLSKHICDHIQGYLLSTPLPVEDAARFLTDLGNGDLKNSRIPALAKTEG